MHTGAPCHHPTGNATPAPLTTSLPSFMSPLSFCFSSLLSSSASFLSAGDLKKRAARIVGNLCTLVNDPRDMAPYVMMLLPELKVGAGWVLGLWC